MVGSQPTYEDLKLCLDLSPGSRKRRSQPTY
jgi:hypothetical protein